MPYMNDTGYCYHCDKNTSNRFSSDVRCKECNQINPYYEYTSHEIENKDAPKTQRVCSKCNCSGVELTNWKCEEVLEFREETGLNIWTVNK